MLSPPSLPAEPRMMDLAYLVLTAALLAASCGLVRLCDKV
jgi:hypothetical protein